MKEGKSQFPGWVLTGIPLAPEIVLVAGGRTPELEWLKETSVNRKLWGVDRGTRAILDADLLPDGVTGDFDSLDSFGLAEIQEKKIPSYPYPADKDFTDLELALEKAQEVFPESRIWITGGFGGRVDHTLGNLRILTSLKEKGHLIGGIIDSKEAIIFVGAGENIRITFINEPKIVSMLPMTAEIEGAFLTGCHWMLPKEHWQMNEMPPISNRLVAGSRELSFSLGEGIAAIYLCWDEQQL